MIKSKEYYDKRKKIIAKKLEEYDTAIKVIMKYKEIYEKHKDRKGFIHQWITKWACKLYYSTYNYYINDCLKELKIEVEDLNDLITYIDSFK